jgi:glycosyltransferase involved in cell wall biosynthesis
LEFVKRPRIAAIIPVLDEEGAIGPVLTAMPLEWVDEVFVVDGGSRDQTVAVASAAGARVLVESERGYGRACARGAVAAVEPGAADPRLQIRLRDRLTHPWGA